MSTLTIRLPDDTAERLTVLALAAFDAHTRFRALAEQGDPAQALAVLDRLDAADSAG